MFRKFFLRGFRWWKLVKLEVEDELEAKEIHLLVYLSKYNSS